MVVITVLVQLLVFDSAEAGFRECKDGWSTIDLLISMVANSQGV